MPAKNPAALEQKRRRTDERDARRRQTYRDSREGAMQIQLSRQHPISKSTDLSQFDQIDCQPVGEGTSSQPARPNLTLVDSQTEAIILQRISPTSYSKHLEAQRSAQLGKFLYDQYLAKKHPSHYTIQAGSNSLNQKLKIKVKLTRRKVAEHHLGIWHSRGKQSLDFTSETADQRYKQEALNLLFWARMHTDLVMKTAQHQIHPSFKPNIAGRSKGRRWLASIFGSRSIELLHPWWTTIAFFSDFAGGIHLDEQDCIPSFLFNFGEAAWIELPEFSTKVLIQPFDLVILNSHTFYHRTHSADSSSPGTRWAFSGFFREAIYHTEAVCKIAQWRLDAVFGNEQT